MWRAPHAIALVGAAVFVGVLAFHLQRRRAAALGFSQVALVRRRGLGVWLADIPGVLRVLAVAAIAVGLARPETFRTVTHEVDTIDIMIVVDMSKSMEEVDMQRDRLDAAQRVIRRFLHHTHNDRIGLVIFGQAAMLQCPLTQDTKVLEQIVSDLEIGDVPELGTAIGDGLGLALAQLRRSDAKSKVVILLSDGDSGLCPHAVRARRSRARGGGDGREGLHVVGRARRGQLLRRHVGEPRDVALDRAAHRRRVLSRRGLHVVQPAASEPCANDPAARRSASAPGAMPNRQLFVPLAILAAALLLLELLLVNGRLRRLP